MTSQAYNPYFAAGPLVPLVTSDPTGATVVSQLGVPQQTVVTQQKVSRDRLEVSGYYRESTPPPPLPTLPSSILCVPFQSTSGQSF